MTDQLERDLTQLFRQRADQTDVPPVPLDLFTTQDPAGWRRRAAIGIVAAAALTAIAVPLGIDARNDGQIVPPAERPTQQPPERPSPRDGMELPYLFEGELHLGAVTLPVEPNASLQVAGSSVLVATSEDDGTNTRWQRVNGDRLEAAPYLDGLVGVQTSYDGRVVAAPVGTDDQASVRIWDTATGAVVDTIELADPTVTEELWFWGFDAAGWLYWRDGEVQRARTPDGDVVTVDTGADEFAGVAPGGVLIDSGSPDAVTIATVNDNGSVALGAFVPISEAVAWRDATTVAYREVGTGRVYVFDVRTGERTEITVKDRSFLAPVGWSGGEVVVTANGEGIMTDVVVVDPATGEQRTVFSYGTDEPNPFAPIGGTGAF